MSSVNAVCHAWAPASIMEPEPRCPVNYKGVIFDVMDLKGLITQPYDKTGSQRSILHSFSCLVTLLKQK